MTLGHFICTVGINSQKQQHYKSQDDFNLLRIRIMETKKETTTKASIKKVKVAPKKRISKTMKAAMKYKGAFDREEVLKYVNL